MGNPLACRAAIANIDVLLDSPWQDNIQRIEDHFNDTLLPLKTQDASPTPVVLGAIGVIELERGDLGPHIQAVGIENGIWVRPFGQLIYTMPAYNIPQAQLNQLTNGLTQAVKTAVQSAIQNA